MTQPRAPHNAYPNPVMGPAGPKRRPSEERAALAASTRTATQVAVIALVVAGIALGLAVWRVLVPSGSSCQSTAWNAEPAADQLPDQWTVKGTTFDVNRRTSQFAGVDPGDGTGAPNVLATVTCFPDGASDVVARSAQAARDIGQVVDDKTDLSDGGYEATDASGAIFLEFRRGDIVVDLAASGGATPTDIETVASAYDSALGGDGGSIATPEPSSSDDLGGVGSPNPSDDTGLSHDAPELEKLLPAKVGSVDLTIDSLLGSAVLTDDAGGRAATATLRADGKAPDDLHYAEAVDQTQTLQAGITAMAVNGLDAAKVRSVIVDWFQLSGSGVTRSDITLAGKAWTKYDLGDGGDIYYLRDDGNAVLVINTSDPSLAEQVAATLP
ncbi:MAG TPA: hypothetical protein VMT69_17870 [Kineosporiaceae bacterium]|nr:hypothetical protein [Kineosporiaceae bacterium]